MMKNFKVFNFAVLFSALLLSFGSCESTQSESSSVNNSNIKQEESTKSPSNFAFEKELETLEIKVIAQPAAPVAGSPFASPYTVSVKDSEGNPRSDFTITVTAPSGKADGKVTYTTFDLTTDAQGKVSYKPETFSTSINGTITFMPKPPVKSNSFVKAAKAHAVEVPCRVRFALGKKSILVNLVDYDQKGKMIDGSGISSSNLVSEFWRAGYPYQAQNADFHRQIDAGSAAVYARAKEMVQGSTYYKYIVYGKVKYASDITEIEGGYSLSLTGSVTVIDWTTGKDIYTVTKTSTVTDKNKWAVLKACQTQLAKDLANDLVYSM